jgi:GNAT superfamily N-acetyltransferase
MRRELPGGYELDDDPQRVDVDAVHAYIRDESYWAKGRPREKMDAALAGSARVIGLYAPDGSQAGFARVISDCATYAYLADVFVFPVHRRKGLGVELVREAVDSDPWSQMSWHLRTADAHKLYEKFGFRAPTERSLER